MGVPYRTQSTIIVSRSNSDNVLAFMIIKMHVLFTNRGSAASDNLLVHVLIDCPSYIVLFVLLNLKSNHVVKPCLKNIVDVET